MKKAPKKGKIAHSKAHKQLPIAEIPQNWQSTSEIAVPERIIDQVIGQDNCVELIKKAAMQKRNVLLVGLPGTGKSMLAQAMAEILPVQKLQDILVYPNPLDSNNPKVKMVDAGKGKQIVNSERMNATAHEHNSRMLAILFPLGFFILSSFMWSLEWISDVIFAATIILGGILLMGFVVASQMRMRFSHETPKLLIDNSEKKAAPFIEATGARAGSLLGDCLHDPLQSGGLGTPAHLRVEPGAIHKANNTHSQCSQNTITIKAHTTHNTHNHHTRKRNAAETRSLTGAKFSVRSQENFSRTIPRVTEQLPKKLPEGC